MAGDSRGESPAAAWEGRSYFVNNGAPSKGFIGIIWGFYRVWGVMSPKIGGHHGMGRWEGSCYPYWFLRREEGYRDNVALFLLRTSTYLPELGVPFWGSPS